MRSGFHDFRLCCSFLSDGFHRVNEQVALLSRLGFGRFDHQRARHNQRKRGRVGMKAVVNQPFRNVHGAYAVFLLNRVAENHFVHRGQGIGQVVNAFEVLSNVIRIEDRVFGGLAHARTVRKNVRERANQHSKVAAERPHAPNRIRPHGLQRQPTVFFFHQDRHRPEWFENVLHRHRTRARPSTAVRR